MAVDKAALLTRRCPERDVDLPSVGTVRVRGLTRAEVVRISKAVSDGQDMEAESLALTFVDPPLTLDEARQLIEVSPFTEIEMLNKAVNELSGIAGRADKEAYKSPGDESGA